MGIFDIFTGKPAVDAAAQQRNYLTGVNTNNTSTINNALTAGTNAVTAGTATARGDIGAGYNDAQGYLGQAADAFRPLSGLGDKYGAATTLGLGALGVGGAAGTEAARAAFQAGPGYQFQMDQGLEAILRNRNASGMGASGNALQESQIFGQGLANQEYDKWLGNLLGFTQPELAATSGAATGLAGVATNQANAATQRGQMLADLAAREGSTIAGLQSGAAGQQVGQNTALASPYSATYGQEAAAQMGGSGNLWNLGLNLGKLAAGMPQFGGTPKPQATAMAPTTGQGYNWFG